MAKVPSPGERLTRLRKFPETGPPGTTALLLREQRRDRHTERLRDPLDVHERHVPFTTLDPADVRAVQSALVGEALL